MLRYLGGGGRGNVHTALRTSMSCGHTTLFIHVTAVTLDLDMLPIYQSLFYIKCPSGLTVIYTLQ